jgi:hypothetical protein
VIEHGCRPGEPGDELKPQTRVARDADIIERGDERGDCPAVHLLVGSIAAVDTHDMGVVTQRGRVRRRSTKLLGPVGGEPPGMFGVDPALEGVSQDRVGQAAPVPRLSERQESVSSTHGLVDRLLHSRRS